MNSLLGLMDFYRQQVPSNNSQPGGPYLWGGVSGPTFDQNGMALRFAQDQQMREALLDRIRGSATNYFANLPTPGYMAPAYTPSPLPPPPQLGGPDNSAPNNYITQLLRR